MRSRWIGVTFAAFLLQAAPARAEDRAAAAALFDQGMTLMEAKNYPAACSKFKESIAASAGLGAMLWLAECYEQSGQTASAWAQFREATQFAAEKNDPREKVAKKRAADLEPKLPHLEIAVASPVPNLEVSRDGTAVASGSWGTPVPIDPGTHVVKATAPGRKSFEQSISIASGANARVAIPVLEETGGRDVPTTGSSDENPGGVQRIAGIGVAGAGLVLVGLGAVFGLKASSKLDDSNANGRCRQPGDLCTPEGLALRDDASSAATISTVMFVLGAAAIAGGAVLYLTAPRSKGTGVLLAPAGAGFAFVGRY